MEIFTFLVNAVKIICFPLWFMVLGNYFQQCVYFSSLDYVKLRYIILMQDIEVQFYQKNTSAFKDLIDFP